MIGKILVLTIILAVIIGGVIVWNMKSVKPLPVTHLAYDLLEYKQYELVIPILAVSPDSKHFAYSTTKGIYLRSVDNPAARLIEGTEDNPLSPFFSPDGQWIGYWSNADQKLKKVVIGGGKPISLCDVSGVRGATWNADGTIVYADLNRGIMQVSANGGVPKLLIETIGLKLAAPQMLPDRKTILYTIMARERNQIAVQSLDSGKRKILFDGTEAQYLSTGHLVYFLGSNLYAVPFDLDALDVVGKPVPIVEDVLQARLSGARPQYVASDSGMLLYISEDTDGLAPGGKTLWWVDREGREERLTAPSSRYRHPRVSPDGTKVALTVNGYKHPRIWIWNLVHKTMTRLTSDEVGELFPLWSHDGKRIIFTRSPEKGLSGIYWKAVDGTGEVEPLVTKPGNMMRAWCWSGAGNILALSMFNRAETANMDIGILSMESNRTLRLLLHENYDEVQPMISPDGRWLAYMSYESSKKEICVRPFPEVEKGKWRVPARDADSPLWSPDGRELFYRSGGAVMVVAVETEPAFRFKTPKILFRGDYFAITGHDFQTLEISPDGERFLMIRDTPGNFPQGPPRKINIVLNWFEELKERAPVE